MKLESFLFTIVLLGAAVVVVLPALGVDWQYEIFCKTFGYCNNDPNVPVPSCGVIGKPPCTRYIYAQTELRVGGAPITTIWNIPYLDLSVRGTPNPIPLAIWYPSGSVKGVFELYDLSDHLIQTGTIVNPNQMDEGGLGSGSVWTTSWAFMAVQDGSYIVKVKFYEDNALVAATQGPIQVT